MIDLKDKTVDELLPCPFCGLPARFTEPRHAEAWGRWVVQVRCSSSHCGAVIELLYDYTDVNARLAESWNRRANNELARRLEEVQEKTEFQQRHIKELIKERGSAEQEEYDAEVAAKALEELMKDFYDYTASYAKIKAKAAEYRAKAKGDKP